MFMLCTVLTTPLHPTCTLSLWSAVLPARRLPLILLVQPFLQRREVIQNGPGVHLALARQGLHRVLPGTAFSHRQHGVQPLAGFFVVVNRGAVQRLFAARLLGQREG